MPKGAGRGCEVGPATESETGEVLGVLSSDIPKGFDKGVCYVLDPEPGICSRVAW